MASAATAPRGVDLLRHCLQLEARLSELLRMLSLPRHSSAARAALFFRQRPQRSHRRPIPGRLFGTARFGHDAECERKDTTAAAGRRRESIARLLLYDFSFDAAESASRLRHGACRPTSGRRPHPPYLRLVLRAA